MIRRWCGLDVSRQTSTFLVFDIVSLELLLNFSCSGGTRGFFVGFCLAFAAEQTEILTLANHRMERRSGLGRPCGTKRQPCLEQVETFVHSTELVTRIATLRVAQGVRCKSTKLAFCRAREKAFSTEFARLSTKKCLKDENSLHDTLLQNV